MDLTAVTISIRPSIDSDLDIFFELQRDPAAVEMGAFPTRDRAAFDAHWITIKADPSVVVKAILSDGDVVGNLVSFVKDGEREVGYILAREHWGKGFASAALGMFLPELPRPLLGVVAAHNRGSIRVLEKHGFIVRKHVVADDGVEEVHLVLE